MEVNSQFNFLEASSVNPLIITGSTPYVVSLLFSYLNIKRTDDAPEKIQMLAAIGEIFETPFVPAPTSVDALTTPTPAPVSPSLPTAIPDEITGVIISSRKAFYRINIWTRTSSSVDRERIENIGKQFKYGKSLSHQSSLLQIYRYRRQKTKSF